MYIRYIKVKEVKARIKEKACPLNRGQRNVNVEGIYYIKILKARFCPKSCPSHQDLHYSGFFFAIRDFLRAFLGF